MFEVGDVLEKNDLFDELFIDSMWDEYYLVFFVFVFGFLNNDDE